jgi:hypothetical protein
MDTISSRTMWVNARPPQRRYGTSMQKFWLQMLYGISESSASQNDRAEFQIRSGSPTFFSLMAVPRLSSNFSIPTKRFAAYRKRQKRYEEYGLECYWLLYQPRFYPLAKSIVKWRIRHEFGGRFPEESIFACVSDLPALILETEPNPIVRGAGRSSAALHEWLRGVLCQRFQWKNGLWDLLEDPEHSVANRLLAESEPT